jgi:hypothetical protein
MASERPLSSSASGITERIKQDGKQKIESTKRSAADQIDQVAQALSRAGEELNQSQPTLANYAAQIASSVSTFSNRLRDGNMDDLVSDARELANRNPGLFILGGVALGFAVSRFLKASPQAGTGNYIGDYSGSSSEDYVSGEYGQESYSGSGASYGGTSAGSFSEGTSAGAQDSTIDVESTSYVSRDRNSSEYNTRNNGG